ncbi:MAG TPA: hypothetical protein ENG62_00120 [Thermoplasmatales archaeon]|nr:hypothetical protein [Thermoplasmatales archaeon]
MQKDELIQLHMFLLQLKNHLQTILGNNGVNEFAMYEKLNVTPYQVYKSKREHTLAVFMLSKGIADLLTNSNYPGLEKISNRLASMCERFMTEKEKHLLTQKEEVAVA